MAADHRLYIALLSSTLLGLSACSMFASPPANRQARTAPAKAPAAAHPNKARAPAAGGTPLLTVGNAAGRPGGSVAVNVTLQTAGASIAGTQNDLAYDPKLISVAQRGNGKPDCKVNPQLGKEGTAFSFLPPGCHGAACTGVRALVLSLSSVDPIPNGSVLYTCAVQIGTQARGAQRLGITRVGFSNPTGQAIAGAGQDGVVTVAP